MSWPAVEGLWVVRSPVVRVKFLKPKNGTLKCFTTQTRAQRVLFPTSVSFRYSVALCQSLLLVRRTKALPVVP